MFAKTGTGDDGEIGEATEEHFDKVFSVNRIDPGDASSGDDTGESGRDAVGRAEPDDRPIEGL